MMMVLGRSYVLATTKGHMIRFTKNEPTYVPEICVSDAVAIGALPVDGTPVDVIGEEKQRDDGPNSPVEREKQIITAIEQIVAQNARKDFTAAGMPQTDAITKRVGYDVGASERNAMWQIYCNRKAAADAEAELQ